jgi:hypothetical protein
MTDKQLVALAKSVEQTKATLLERIEKAEATLLEAFRKTSASNRHRRSKTNY